MIPVPYIIKSIIESLTFTQAILSIVDNLDGTFTLGVCKTYHLQPVCSYVSIDSVNYRVVGIVNNESITIKAGAQPPQTEVIISAPKYFNGTRPAVNEELSQINQESDKLPLVYLFEIITETYNNNDELQLERESALRLFFLGPANFESWKTVDHYDNAIIPMTNLALAFIDYLNNNECDFQRVDNYSLINHAKFGVFTDNKGHTNNFFNENLSGVEMRITLPINKSIACSDACN
jgi:hypothetical protein